MRLYKSTAILLFSIWVCAAAFAQEDRIEQLRQKAASQQQKIEQLERQLGQEANASSDSITAEYINQPDATNPGPIAGYNKGFFVQTPDGDWLLKFNGYLRHHLFISEANTVQHNTYSATDNRLDLHVYFKKDWHARVRTTLEQTIPNGGVDVWIREAYVEYLGVSSLKFRMGAMLVPFAMTGETNPVDTLAISPAPYASSIPVRDVGAMIFGDGIPFFGDDFLSNYMSYSLGVFNGDGTTSMNFNDDMMFVSQIQFFPLTNEDRNFFCYISTFLQHTGAREDGSRIRLWGLQNHEVFGRDFPGPGVNDDVDDTKGRQVGISAGLRHWRDNLRFELEYVWIRYNRDRQTNAGVIVVDDRHPLEMWGISAGISYFFALGEPGDNMGFEPLFRASYTTIDDRHGDGTGYGVKPFGTATDVRGQDIWEVILGAKFHLSSHARVDFNWIMYDLAETSAGVTNSERGEGGGILHAFVFQFSAKW